MLAHVPVVRAVLAAEDFNAKLVARLFNNCVVAITFLFHPNYGNDRLQIHMLSLSAHLSSALDWAFFMALSTSLISCC